MKPTIDFSILALPSLNRMIKIFIFADLVLLAGWGFINPIFAVFVVEEISRATLVTVGVVAALYWGVKAVFQIPIALFLDRTDGERDDFYALIIGIFIVAIAAFALILATEIWHIYVIESLKAIGFALYVPPWNAIFTRHVDKDHTAFDWAFHSSAIGLSVGTGGLLGGWIANNYGFDIVFLLVGLLSLVTAGILIFVPELVLPRKVTTEPSRVPPQITTPKRHI